MSFNLLGANQADCRSLGRIVDERTVEFGLCGDRFHLFLGIRLDFLAIKERSQFPTIGPVKDLNRSLTVKLHFHSHFSWTLQFHHKGQAHLLGRPRGRRETAVFAAGHRKSAPVISTHLHFAGHCKGLY